MSVDTSVSTQEPPSQELPQLSVQSEPTKPFLVIKNIHPELTESDMIDLFSKVSSVESFKFDDPEHSTAQLTFESDNEQHRRDAIRKFNGKKAMGNILVVEDPHAKPLSLKDRIQLPKGPRTFRGSNQPRRGPQARGFKKSKGPRSQKHGKVAKKTAEQLDAELSAYMNQL